MQRVPIAARRVPGRALGRLRTVLEIGVDLLVGGDEAGLGTRLDRHVAHGHAPFHRQRRDRVAGVFQRITGAAGGADLADDGEDDVLRRHALGQLALDEGAHVLRLLLVERLGREHVLDLGCADAVGERSERAVGRGVAVAADERGARQGEALLRPDDVHDALAAVELVVILEAEQLGVLGEIGDLRRALRIRIGLGAVGGRHVVVDHAERLFRRMHLAAGEPQPLESLRARYLVDQVPVYVNEAGAAGLLVDEMVFPDFIIERTRGSHERCSFGSKRRCDGADLVARAGKGKCPWPQRRQTVDAWQGDCTAHRDPRGFDHPADEIRRPCRPARHRDQPRRGGEGSRTEIVTQPAPCVDAAPVSAASLYKAYAPDLSDR